MTPEEIEVANTEAIKILVDAKKLLEEAGLDASLITRSVSGSKWPVYVLVAGVTHSNIEASRIENRQ